MGHGDKEDAECAVCHLYLHLSGGEPGWRTLCTLGWLLCLLCFERGAAPAWLAASSASCCVSSRTACYFHLMCHAAFNSLLPTKAERL